MSVLIRSAAWKIAYVLKGWADMSLLATVRLRQFTAIESALTRAIGQYESERRTFAQDLIAFDRKWAKFFDRPDAQRLSPAAGLNPMMLKCAAVHRTSARPLTATFAGCTRTLGAS